MDDKKPLRGLSALLAKKENLADMDSLKDSPKSGKRDNSQSETYSDMSIEKEYVKVGLIMDVDDDEFYKNWLYHQKISKFPTYSHRDAQREIMELIREKYPDVKPRPESQRANEQKYKKKTPR